MGEVVPFPDRASITLSDLLEIPTNDSPKIDAAACWRCMCGSFEFHYYVDGVLECSRCYTMQVGWDGREES